MKRKYWLIIASIMMILIGLLRGFGGISLLIKGNHLVTDIPIIGSSIQIKLAAYGLILICVLTNYSSINLLRKYSKKSWNLCLVVLFLFLLGGLINGYLLFGHPLDQGQKINFISVIVVSGFLLLGKPGLKDLK